MYHWLVFNKVLYKIIAFIAALKGNKTKIIYTVIVFAFPLAGQVPVGGDLSLIPLGTAYESGQPQLQTPFSRAETPFSRVRLRELPL